MEMTLKRRWLSPVASCGELYLDSDLVPFCFTLELHEADDGTKPMEAIPLGRYHVKVAWSDHFARNMPLLEQVPGRSAIEIHWGGKPANTKGCILVGYVHLVDQLLHTLAAFMALFPKIEEAQPDCWITIEDAPNA
jgi:hypothetical protein